MRAAVLMGFRTLMREWRSGDLAVLFLALIVAVAALTGVGFLADRIQQAMRLKANEVLAADLRLESGVPIRNEYAEEAERRGMQAARVTSMLSVVLHGERTQLASAIAVSSGYPLRGEVQTAEAAFGTASVASGIPQQGEVWLDSRMLSSLDAKPGDKVFIGAAEFTVARALVSRPDQGGGFADLAPALLLNEADLPATKLIQAGSRVKYEALFSGSVEATSAFSAWLKQHATPAESLRDVAQVSPEVGKASERATRFLSLASLAGVLLCAVAIALTARRYVKRHLDLAALLKTLGAARSSVLTVCLVQLVCVALLATVVGSVAGFIAQQGLLLVMRDMVGSTMPAPGWRPVLMGLVAALLLLVGFALPSMLQLSRVPAIRVLRRDIGPPPLGVLLAYGPAVLAITLLVYWVVGSWLALWFVLGLAVAMLVLALAGWVVVSAVGRLRGVAGVSWRYGVASLSRRRAESIVQIVALGLGLSILLLLTILRGDLIDQWQAQLPANAPNFFFVNIPQNERTQFDEELRSRGGNIARMLPMIRGRMTALNHVPTATLRFPDGRGNGFATREQNLTWAASIGPDNVITEGKWFSAEDFGKPLVSVATNMQQAMHLKLGDVMEFDVAGEKYEVTISSFRNVQWDSMQPNFFLMFAPGLLEDSAGTWMASAQFKPDSPKAIADLVRRFPGVSIFDTGGLLAQVRSIVDKAVLAVQSVFLFTLLAGVMVLIAAVQSTRDERRYESAMLRTLGASRRMVRTGVLVEFGLIGLLAGVVASAAASTAAWLLATRQLDIPYTPNPMLWLAGAVSGAVLVCVAGYLATRSALTQPPMATLRIG